MKNTMRKLFSLALVVVMLACAIPFSAFAASSLDQAVQDQKAAQKAVNDAQDMLDIKATELAIAQQAADAAQTKLDNAKKIADARLSDYQLLKGTNTDNENNAYNAWRQAVQQIETEQGLLDDAKGALETARTAWASAKVDLESKARVLAEANAEVSRWKGATGTSDGGITIIIPDGSTGSSTGGGTTVITGGGSSSNNGGIGNIVIGGGNGGTIIGGGSNSGSNSGSNTGSNTGSNNNTSGGIWLGNNNTVVNKDPYPVYLNIYLNGNVSTIAKKVDITKGIAADGYVDLADVKTVVRSYFNAKDSDGILYDGLYIFDGSFGGQYTTDVGRVDGYGNINEDRKLSTVNINVMIKNAVAKGSVASDPSNPKTGDMAFLTVTALVASAGALALVYANKKRFLVK